MEKYFELVDEKLRFLELELEELLKRKKILEILNLKQVFTIIRTFAISLSKCEKSFSYMNSLVIPMKNARTSENIFFHDQNLPLSS